MTVVGLILSWLFAILLGLLTFSMFLTRNYVQAVLLLIAVLILLPPVRKLILLWTGWKFPTWLVVVAVVVLLFGFVMAMRLLPATSIYASPACEASLMQIYDAKLDEWPVEHESVYLDTEYGRVHVVVSGPEDGQPLLLLHVSAIPAWSWWPNVEAWNQQYRTYAVDTLGDASRSTLTDINHHPETSEDLARLFTEITDQLGLDVVDVVGGSEGGFIATSYALYAPERVKSLSLLGPMGMTPNTAGTVLRITLASLFPLKPVGKITANWALGEDASVQESCGDWFGIITSCLYPQKARPVAFEPQQLQNLQVPVLLVLGTRDALVGDPETVKPLAQNVPDIQIEVVDSGHLIGVEQAEAVNQMVLDFLEAH